MTYNKNRQKQQSVTIQYSFSWLKVYLFKIKALKFEVKVIAEVI
jgi:hypothetical protein